MESPEVVVACAWYNRAEYIRDTVDSLLSQEFDKFEVVIVNDGSTDPRVKEILDSYDDSRLRVIHQENSGFVKAISTAIESSAAPFIAIQGAGDVSFPQRLFKQWSLLKLNKEYSATGCWYKNIVIEGKTSKPLNEVCLTGPFSWDYCLRKNPYSHGEVMFRRTDYEKAGKYRFVFEKAQDRDLWLRLGKVGLLASVQETLYERRMFVKDGISASPEATVKQILLSELAVTASKIRAATGKDPVDDMGHQAMLIRRHSLRSLKVLVFAAGLFQEKKDSVRAGYYKSLAKNENLIGRLAVFFMIDLRVLLFVRCLEKKFEINLGLDKKFKRFLGKSD